MEESLNDFKHGDYVSYDETSGEWYEQSSDSATHRVVMTVNIETGVNEVLMLTKDEADYFKHVIVLPGSNKEQGP